MRDSARQIDTRSREATAAREAEILAESASMQQQASAQAEDGDAVRYEVRREAGGYAVYDSSTGRIARIGARTQNGLTRQRAEDVLADLEEEQLRERMSGALFK